MTVKFCHTNSLWSVQPPTGLLVILIRSLNVFSFWKIKNLNQEIPNPRCWIAHKELVTQKYMSHILHESLNFDYSFFSVVSDTILRMYLLVLVSVLVLVFLFVGCVWCLLEIEFALRCFFNTLLLKFLFNPVFNFLVWCFFFFVYAQDVGAFWFI